MPESKSATPHFSAERAIGSDLARVDAHLVAAEEYEDLPELTDAWFSSAVRHEDGIPANPDGELPNHRSADRQVTLRLDADVIARLHASGPGWESRVNAILRKALN